MVAPVVRPRLGWSARLLLGGLVIFAAGALLFRLVSPPTPAQDGSLLDRARQGTWWAPAATTPPASPVGYQESDFLYLNGQYYLFATGSQDPAWVDVYVGTTPADLVQSKPVFTHVAPLRYPTVVKDGVTWHMWGVNPPQKWTEHWVSHQADPTGFVYADSPFQVTTPPWGAGFRGAEFLDPIVRAVSTSPVVDFAVRRHPTDGYWYGVGFEIEDNAPLLLTRAAAPYGPWERLNYVPSSRAGGVFGDTGAPPWANAARPDPNLVFTAEDRAWILFTGRPQTQQPPPVRYRSGIVEVDVTTGKALGNPVVLFDPPARATSPFPLASDLSFVPGPPGQPDRIFGYTGNPQYPLAVLDVPAVAAPADGRTTADLVRLDTSRGWGVAAGITPAIARAPYQWTASGLEVPTEEGWVGSYLAGASLADFTVTVDFTPTRINEAIRNTVAYLGGPDYDAGAALSVQLDPTAEGATITAHLWDSTGSSMTLDSGVIPDANTEYVVVVRRVGARVTLTVNGTARATAPAAWPLTDLESWSLTAEATLTQAPRYPFQGTIHAFVVTGSGNY